MSACCFAISAWVSGVERWTSGSVAAFRCGAAISPARGTMTWACMSTVRLLGRVCCPGLPRVRAAVGSYLFQTSAISLSSRFVMPGLMPGIHVFLTELARRGWPGNRRAKRRRLRRLCPAMTWWGLENPQMLAQVDARAIDLGCCGGHRHLPG